jgi:hypothetical protein
MRMMLAVFLPLGISGWSAADRRVRRWAGGAGGRNFTMMSISFGLLNYGLDVYAP